MSPPVKSCSLDPMPTFLIREFVDHATDTVRDSHRQLVVESRSTTGEPRTRHRITSSQEARSRHSRHGEFSTSLEFLIPVESRWTSCGTAVKWPHQQERSASWLSVGFQTTSLDWAGHVTSRVRRVDCRTSRPSWGNFIGFQCDSALNSNWQFWCTKRWPVFTIFGGRLLAYLYCRSTTTMIVQRRHVWGSNNSHQSGRSLIHCCWTASADLHLRDSEHTFLEFRRLLKTHFFAEDSGMTAFCAPYKSAFTLHYIHCSCTCCVELTESVNIWCANSFANFQRRLKSELFASTYASWDGSALSQRSESSLTWLIALYKSNSSLVYSSSIVTESKLSTAASASQLLVRLPVWKQSTIVC